MEQRYTAEGKVWAILAEIDAQYSGNILSATWCTDYFPGQLIIKVVCKSTLQTWLQSGVRPATQENIVPSVLDGSAANALSSNACTACRFHRHDQR